MTKHRVRGWNAPVYNAYAGRWMTYSEACGWSLRDQVKPETVPDCIMADPEDQARVQQYARARGQAVARWVAEAPQYEDRQPWQLPVWADNEAEGAMRSPAARPTETAAGEMYFWPDDPVRYKKIFVKAFLEGYQEGAQGR